jgi:hypothetical protein
MAEVSVTKSGALPQEAYPRIILRQLETGTIQMILHRAEGSVKKAASFSRSRCTCTDGYVAYLGRVFCSLVCLSTNSVLKADLYYFIIEINISFQLKSKYGLIPKFRYCQIL